MIGFWNNPAACRILRLCAIIIPATLILTAVMWVQGAELSSFRQALPGYQYQFPRDFYSHDDFKIEWWYYTGNLEDESQRPLGYQLTFFRVAPDGADKIENPSRWKIDHVYFAHMTVSDPDANRFHFFERINRGALNNAGAKSDRLLVWNEDWILTGKGKSHRLKALEAGTGLDLVLTPVKDLVIHGESGVSVKGEEKGNASHYFSYTRMKTEGKIFIEGKEYKVRGTSWMDHEFSSNQLSRQQVGWDWFSLKLDNQVEIMLYQIRLKDGRIEPFSSGTLILSDNSRRHLNLDDFSITPIGQWTSQRTKITYPAGWEVSLPKDQVYLKIIPDMPAQELYDLRSISGSYWEGSVTLEGRYKGLFIKGKGYVELVGYGKAPVTGLQK